VEEEIEGAEVGELEALDKAVDAVAEVGFDAVGGDLFDEHGVVAILVGDHADVAGVALVPGAGVGDLGERNLHAHDYHIPMRMLWMVLLAAPLFGQDAAVRDLVRRYVEARDAGDAKKIEALFTADADQLVSSGEWRRGIEAVVKGTVAASQSETGKRTITVETVRFVSADVAIADGRYEIGTRKMWTTLVCVRKPEGWRIAAIRNMLPAASGSAVAR